MGRCRCNGGRGGGGGGGTSRIRYIYTVYVTKSTVILKNSIGIIVVSYSEKATAPHSSPLARKIPWTEEPGRSPVGRSPRCRTESDTTERLPFPFSLSRLGEGHGNPPQCSCLENPRDGGARRATVYGVAQIRTRLNTHTYVLDMDAESENSRREELIS